MKDLLKSLREFLNKYHQPGKPVLLGYSGGPDSAALLHSLWKIRECYAIHLIVIHIDHGWREESAEEAAQLKRQVEALGFPFFIERLEKVDVQKNLEERARTARLALFQKHYKILGAQALALAHQASDQAETVLKRVFEGSHIMALGAMQKVSSFEGMTIWRPLLDLSKKALLGYCSENSISYLVDRTNHDARFLRARMRENLLPILEQSFGKGIETNLVRLAQGSREIAEYLSVKIQGILNNAKVEDQEISMDLNDVHPLEAKLAIRKMLEVQGIRLGQQHLELVGELLKKESNTKKFVMGGVVFCANKGFLKILLNQTKSTENEDFIGLVTVRALSELPLSE